MVKREIDTWQWPAWPAAAPPKPTRMRSMAITILKKATKTPETETDTARAWAFFRKACRCDTEARSACERTRWLERNELARLYHYKGRNQLPPLKNSRRDPIRQ